MSEYLQRFRLDVKYKSGKSNIVFNALSRLTSKEYRSEIDESLDALTTVHCFPINLMQMNSEFRQRLLDEYKKPR